MPAIDVIGPPARKRAGGPFEARFAGNSKSEARNPKQSRSTKGENVMRRVCQILSVALLCAGPIARASLTEAMITQRHRIVEVGSGTYRIECAGGRLVRVVVRSDDLAELQVQFFDNHDAVIGVERCIGGFCMTRVVAPWSGAMTVSITGGSATVSVE
jgi:hypothetical protein